MKIKMLVATLALTHIGGIAWSATPQEIAKKAFPSTVLLVLKDRQGQTISLGSGFLIARDTIVTNLHVVRGASSGVAKLIGQNAQISIEGVTAVDYRADLALIKVKINAPYLQLADKTTVEVGETVYAVGNPQGLEGTFSQGIVSAIRSFQQGRLIQITAPISPGSSGGPVLNANGEVVGVAVATLKSGQNLNFAIPVISVSGLLAKQGTPKTFPTSDSENTATGRPREEKKASGGRSTGEQGPSLRTAVSGHSFAWSKEKAHGWCGENAASFSIRNSLSLPIIDVQGVVIFYSKGIAIGQQEFRTHNSTIPAHATERISEGICGDVKSLTSKVEVRVLDFVTLDEQGTCMYIRRYRSLAEGADKTNAGKEIVDTLVMNQCRRLNVDPQTCERCSSSRN